MSVELRRRLFEQLQQITLIDPHTHINALSPAATNLGEILGYHYYTELAHSAGMPREQIEEENLGPREKVRRLIENLGPIENTIQHSWLIEMAREFFDFEGDRITPDNWEAIYDRADSKMSGADWSVEVLRKSNLEGVFLTNDFDDPLEGFDTKIYIPCLRTDDLVFHYDQKTVRERLAQATNTAVTDSAGMRKALGVLFRHFKRKGAKACAISLPPDFSPQRVKDRRADVAIEALWSQGEAAAPAHRRAAAHWIFWTLAELCDQYRLPFDLMIGVNRGVYEGGVFQGQDLYDSRVSLIQYRELFNAFPNVTFPISVLASVTNQELVSYAWIFPNVVSNGHWWYSNTPTFIEQDAAARLEAIPQTKQIGYYSDMYKLEFALPKFNMYKRILAKILAERFVIDRGWSEEKAFDLGSCVLRGNVEQIFRIHEEDDPSLYEEPPQPTAAAAGIVPPTGESASLNPTLDEFTIPTGEFDDDENMYQFAESTDGEGETQAGNLPDFTDTAEEMGEDADDELADLLDEEGEDSGGLNFEPMTEEASVSAEDEEADSDDELAMLMDDDDSDEETDEIDFTLDELEDESPVAAPPLAESVPAVAENEGLDDDLAALLEEESVSLEEEVVEEDSEPAVEEAFVMELDTTPDDAPQFKDKPDSSLPPSPLTPPRDSSDDILTFEDSEDVMTAPAKTENPSGWAASEPVIAASKPTEVVNEPEGNDSAEILAMPTLTEEADSTSTAEDVIEFASPELLEDDSEPVLAMPTPNVEMDLDDEEIIPLDDLKDDDLADDDFLEGIFDDEEDK